MLSRFEVVGSQASLDTYDEFNNLDFDRDGSLERAEWHWSNVSFQQRDTNRDGILSQARVRSGGRRAGQRHAADRSARATIRVNSQQRWTDTGLNVRAGDVVTFQASGEIRMSDDTGDIATPAGSRRGRTAPDAPILNQSAGALDRARSVITRRCSIGNRGSVTVPVSGRLYLSVNDDHLPDNAGEFTVTVGIQNRTLRLDAAAMATADSEPDGSKHRGPQTLGFQGLWPLFHVLGSKVCRAHSSAG